MHGIEEKRIGERREVDEQRRSQLASDLLQISATIAGIAIALATLSARSSVTPFLLLGGLSSLAGSGYALASMWSEAGLSRLALLPRRRPAGYGAEYEALVYTAWGLTILGGAYVALLIKLFV